MPSRLVALAALIVGLISISLAPALPSTSPTPGSVRAYATIYSIGIEWDISDDPDHDATAQVQYRVQGSDRWRQIFPHQAEVLDEIRAALGDATWTEALPLVRVDDHGYNMLAGSIFFLNPGTTYDVRIHVTDPDTGAETRTLTVATRPLPALPKAGRILHVGPGSEGGDGSPGNPFKGIQAAQAHARPGDIFLVHAGQYAGRSEFTKSGDANNYIVWKAAGDGEALFPGIDVSASHLWLESLTVRDQSEALVSKRRPTDVIISRCSFFKNFNSINLKEGGTDWYIADNTIVGNTPVWTESFDGEGIALKEGSFESHGHVVAHNTITNVADGISGGDSNIDVFGNDIYDTADDGFEGEPGRANIRIWRNRIHNAAHNGISFQPQRGAPWYIIRNQLVGFKESPFKFRETDRSVIVHNTIVNWSRITTCCESHLLRSIVKNNLWISVFGGQIWNFGSSVKDWQTDFDHDGFDWGSNTTPFSYGGVTYAASWAWSAASGLETSGHQIDKHSCFETFQVPGPPLTSIPPQYMTLKAGCNAIDAGAILPNLNDGFVGVAPDLGAYEHGLPLPVYGPRPVRSGPPN